MYPLAYSIQSPTTASSHDLTISDIRTSGTSKVGNVPAKKPSATGIVDKLALKAALNSSAEEFYKAHVRSWLAGTRHESSISVMTRHRRFAKLVEMGDPALDFTLQKLKDGDVQVQWFPLLKRISGEDPVPPEDRGFTDRMVDHWIAWGNERGR